MPMPLPLVGVLSSLPMPMTLFLAGVVSALTDVVSLSNVAPGVKIILQEGFENEGIQESYPCL